MAIGQQQLSMEEFNLIRKLVYDRFGIHLNEQKKSLVVERLQKTLRTGQFESFRAYYDYVVSDRSGRALLELVDRISTNHTHFFREKDHFVFMQTTWLPALKKAEVRYRRQYQTRHTFASMMLTAGESPVWLAQQMGHSDLTMISRTYGRWIADAAPEAGNRAVEMFGEKAAEKLPKRRKSMPNSRQHRE